MLECKGKKANTQHRGADKGWKGLKPHSKASIRNHIQLSQQTLKIDDSDMVYDYESMAS